MPVTPAKKVELTEYVRKEYKIPASIDLALSKDTLLDGGFHELTFTGKGSIKSWEVKLYLSPDERYLTPELLDTKMDPVAERHRKEEELMAELSQNKGTSKGPDKADITIVEFSDFECPFCRRFASIFDQLSPAERENVRLVFHHMPLSMHPWARPAAEGAACAQLQSADAFWTMHDELFQHQSEMNETNVKDKIIEYAKNIKTLDQAAFQSCLANQLSLGLVFRDLELAAAKNINSTPTLFVNGRRLSGIKDVTQLRQVIQDTRSETEVRPSRAAKSSEHAESDSRKSDKAALQTEAIGKCPK